MFHTTSATEPAPPDFPGRFPQWGKQFVPVLGAAQASVCAAAWSCAEHMVEQLLPGEGSTRQACYRESAALSRAILEVWVLHLLSLGVFVMCCLNCISSVNRLCFQGRKIHTLSIKGKILAEREVFRIYILFFLIKYNQGEWIICLFKVLFCVISLQNLKTEKWVI